MAALSKGVPAKSKGMAALDAVTILACYLLLPTPVESRSAPSATGSPCPAGTRAHSRSCVLDSDLELHEPLVLESFMTLDCRGHRLLPVSRGTGTTPETYFPSVPPLAVAIIGDRGVDVRNCRIGEEGRRFDFGIIAVNAKDAGPSGHRIHDNEISARDAGITLLRVDDARLNDNVITWSNGFGIALLRDSDRNRINDNVLSSAGAPPAAIRFVPDGPFRSASDEGIFVVAQYPQPLFNLVLAGRLYQFPNFENGSYPGNDDNVIEANQLFLPGSSVGKAHGAIEVGGNSTRTRVVGNAVHAAGYGIRFAGGMAAQPLSRPGVCLSPAGTLPRHCAADADCFIPQIDETPLGTCSGLVSDVRDLRARDTLAEYNTLVGPFNSTTTMRAGIFGGHATVGGIIRHNRILGTGIEPGITLAGNMIQSGVVTGNVVHGASVGLLLQQGRATSFGAQVVLNDITGSTSRAVGVTGPYNLPTELSSNGVGNFWGHAIPPCFRVSDTPVPGLIEDSAPFCVPVAASAKWAETRPVCTTLPRAPAGAPRRPGTPSWSRKGLTLLDGMELEHRRRAAHDHPARQFRRTCVASTRIDVLVARMPARARSPTSGPLLAGPSFALRSSYMYPWPLIPKARPRARK